jgi:hypothetical protein
MNAEIDVLNHQSGHYAFEVVGDTERSRDILARTLQFMRRHLHVPDSPGQRPMALARNAKAECSADYQTLTSIRRPIPRRRLGRS